MEIFFFSVPIQHAHYTTRWKTVNTYNVEIHVDVYNTSKVWLNFTILSQETSEFLFLSSSSLKSHLEGKLDLIKLIYAM